MTHPLDNPVLSSLTGGHASFAEKHGNALRYPVDVVPFAALPGNPGPADWADLAALAGPGTSLALAAERSGPPEGWRLLWGGEGVQLIDAGVDAGAAAAEPDGDVVRLGRADVPEMLDLTARTKPGPSSPGHRVPARGGDQFGRHPAVRSDGFPVAAGHDLPGHGDTRGPSPLTAVR